LDEALAFSRPEIFNTHQGYKFTAQEYTGRLEEVGIAVSRAGRGRAVDDVFVERLWRSVKYEDIYIKDYERIAARRRLKKYPELPGRLSSPHLTARGDGANSRGRNSRLIGVASHTLAVES
jgi:putative transposase